MKIMIIVPDLVLGGVTSVVSHLVIRLQKKNVEIKLITLFDRAIHTQGLQAESLAIHSVLDIPRAVLQLKKIIAEFKPDLIHTHTLYSHLITYCCAYLNKTYKLISSEHGTYTAQLKFYKRMNLFKIMNPIADLVTNVSDASCASYTQQNIVEKSKMQTMYNGIDLAQYKFCPDTRAKIRAQLNLDDSTKLIGFVGRLSVEKNVENLIEAVALLQRDYRLLIIGDGSEKENICDLIEKKKLTDRVVMLGAVNGVSPYYSAFDVLALPSNTEGLPTVILEALASNCLVVATDCGGVREIFPSDYPFIVPIKNAALLNKKIDEFFDLEHGELGKLTQQCYAKLISTFSLEETLKHWLDLYGSIIDDK